MPGFGALPDLLEKDNLQIAVLGSGDERYHYYLRALAHRFSNLGVRLDFDEALAHLIEAGSDFFLMPSRYEPCGLNQLYSLRYGTLPIVTRTGGLVDTVQPIGPKGGTGFFIEEASPSAIVQAVTAAVQMWHRERTRIETMQRAAMKLRFEWPEAAEAYISAFTRAIEAASAD